METLNSDGKNSTSHKTQIMVHSIHEREQQRESTSAPATAGEHVSPAPSPHEHGALSGGPLEHGQDTQKTPKAPQATKRQGTFFLWHMDGLFSCWHLLNIHRRAAISSGQFNKRCFPTCVKSRSHAASPYQRLRL